MYLNFVNFVEGSESLSLTLTVDVFKSVFSYIKVITNSCLTLTVDVFKFENSMKTLSEEGV